MLKFSVSIFLILTILVTIFWREKVSSQEKLIAAQLSSNSKLNFELSYALKTSGFPNRTDTEIQELEITERDRQNNFKVNRILIMSLIYNSDESILSINPPVQLRIDDNLLEVPNGTLEISISKKKGTFTLHGENLITHINGKDLLTIKDLIFATRFIKKNSPKHPELFIKIQELYFTRFYNESTKKHKNMTFTFVLSKNLIELLGLNRIPFLGEKITRAGSATQVTVEVLKTNLDIEKDLHALPSVLRELLYSSQVYR